MRRNYILFHFPWVWLNLQRQKASLEVPGDWKKKKKKKISLPTGRARRHVRTQNFLRGKLLRDGPETRIQRQKKDVTVSAPAQGGSPPYELHDPVRPQHQPCAVSSPAAANPAISPDVPWLPIYSRERERAALPRGF